MEITKKKLIEESLNVIVKKLTVLYVNRSRYELFKQLDKVTSEIERSNYQNDIKIKQCLDDYELLSNKLQEIKIKENEEAIFEAIINEYVQVVEHKTVTHSGGIGGGPEQYQTEYSYTVEPK